MNARMRQNIAQPFTVIANGCSYVNEPRFHNEANKGGRDELFMKTHNTYIIPLQF